MLYVIAPINFILRLNPLVGDEKGPSSEVLLSIRLEKHPSDTSSKGWA